MTESLPFEHLRKIFRAALDRVDPGRMIRDHVRLEGDRLRVDAGSEGLDLDLRPFRRIVVLGAGKGTAPMALAIEEIFADRLAGGLIALKYGHTQPLRRIATIEAGHPVPDANSAEAARRMLALAAGADAETLVINLISGGGSALLSAPAGGTGLTLADKQQVTRALLACGATIDEVNCVRKHLSAIKGGRLARAIHPARCLSLILSDVVGDRLDVIASGPTSPDPTTFADALKIIAGYGLTDEVPAKALAVLRQGAAGEGEETPKPGDGLFAKVSNVLIGSNHLALLAAAEQARGLGYRTVVLTSQVTGEAREWARVLVGIGKDVRHRRLLVSPPACILAGGETTVTLRGRGKGGRNQEIALAALAQMALDPGGCAGLYLLAASTDGNDGPTDAAGAFAAVELLERASAAGLSLEQFLRDNDSYHFFDRLGFLHRTGPTNTNVCDLQILLVPEFP